MELLVNFGKNLHKFKPPITGWKLNSDVLAYLSSANVGMLLSTDLPFHLPKN